MPLKSKIRKKQIPFIFLILGGSVFLGIALPMIALLFHVPWSQMIENLGKPQVRAALRVSMVSSFIIGILGAIFGIPLAWLLTRLDIKLRRFIRPVVVSALVFPPTVAGLALVALLGENSTIGRWLFQMFGFKFTGSFVAVVIAGLFVGMPFLVLVVESSFEKLNLELEQLAQTEGASPLQIFWHISFPQVIPAVLAGMALTWARALGEFGATMTFAGAFPGKTFTTAMQIYKDLKSDHSAAYSLSGLMLLIAFVVIFAFHSMWLPELGSKGKPE